jgi:YD repeat-containing protein
VPAVNKNSRPFAAFSPAAKMPLAMRLLCPVAISLAAALAHTVVGQGLPAAAVRVTVSINADGSRTTYRFDDAHHTATATTTTREGKLLGTTRYTLDDAGHFATGEIYGADSKLHFKSVYKYDDAGRQTQEIQSDKSDNVLHKIVYTYDSLGKPTGYAIYDGSGRLISQTNAPRPSVTPTKKKKSR